MKPKGEMVKWIVGHFFLKVQWSSKFFGGFSSAKAKFSALILLELVSYSKFAFSRPDLVGNKAAKGKYVVRNARDKKVFI